MPSSDLIEFHANALALAVLIQAKAKGKAEDEDEAEGGTYQKRFLAQPIADMTKGHLKKFIEKRVDWHMQGHLYRIDRLEKTAESHGIRITQLEANQKPPQFN